MKNNKCVALVAAIMMAFSTAGSADVAIVVNAETDISEISEAHLAKIFLGKASKTDAGKLIIPIDQHRGSDLRTKFYQELIHKDEAQLKTYWAKQVFTGQARPPRMLDNDEEIKSFVAGNPSTIGYIASSSVDDSVKVIMQIP